MQADIIRDEVRKTYGEIAKGQVSGGCCGSGASSSCCGPTPSSSRALGYSDDEKPTPREIVDPITGVVMFSVKVGKWRGMDFQYLKETYPHIYAECELSKPTVSIKIP